MAASASLKKSSHYCSVLPELLHILPRRLILLRMVRRRVTVAFYCCVAKAVNYLWRRLCINKKDKKRHGFEMLQREKLMRGKVHWPPKCVVRRSLSLFTRLAKSRQTSRNLTHDPGGCKFTRKRGLFSTTAWRVTSPTWGAPPPCKHALNNKTNNSKPPQKLWKLNKSNTHGHYLSILYPALLNKGKTYAFCKISLNVTYLCIWMRKELLKLVSNQVGVGQVIVLKKQIKINIFIDSSSNAAFPGQLNQIMKQIMQMNVTWSKIPIDERQTIWLFTSMTKKLN